MDIKKYCGLKERIDFNAKLKSGLHSFDETAEGYQIKWVGKDFAKLQSNMLTETIIIPDTTHNKLSKNIHSENLFFTGDNIEILRHLQNAYANTIKMIYIDPPYNTGYEFAYNDNFKYSDERFNDLPEIFKKTNKNHSTNRQDSHSAWLTFIYPRLKLAKNLLTEDGVIFISVDDNEQANLKIICNEIFGENNVDVMIWKKSGDSRDGKMKNTTTFRKDHEYIIVCFNKTLQLNKSYEKPTYVNEYGNSDNDKRGAWLSGSISHAAYASNKNSDNYYEVISPTGNRIKRQFDISKEKFLNLDKNGRIFWGKDGMSIPRIKIFINEKKEVTTSSFIQECVINNKYCTTTQGSKELEELFNIKNIGKELRPKPIELIYKLIQIGSNENDIIMDFFAGSATTAHAVMKFNAENDTKRKFILVQLPEQIDCNKITHKSGFRTIDELSRKRIELSAEQIQKTTNKNIDYGFKHYYVKNIATETIKKITTTNSKKDLCLARNMVEEFNNKFSDGKDVILTTWKIADGYKPDTNIRQIDFSGYKSYCIDNFLLYLINPGWSTEQTEQLLKQISKKELNPTAIIIYGYSFTIEKLKELTTNIENFCGNKILIKKRI